MMKHLCLALTLLVVGCAETGLVRVVVEPYPFPLPSYRYVVVPRVVERVKYLPSPSPVPPPAPPPKPEIHIGPGPDKKPAVPSVPVVPVVPSTKPCAEEEMPVRGKPYHWVWQ